LYKNNRHQRHSSYIAHKYPRLENLERAGFRKDVVRLPKSTAAPPSAECRHHPLFGCHPPTRLCFLPAPVATPDPSASPNYCPVPGTIPDLGASPRCCPTPPDTPALIIAALTLLHTSARCRPRLCFPAPFAAADSASQRPCCPKLHL
jgi:hypothetical protein